MFAPCTATFQREHRATIGIKSQHHLHRVHDSKCGILSGRSLCFWYVSMHIRSHSSSYPFLLFKERAQFSTMRTTARSSEAILKLQEPRRVLLHQVLRGQRPGRAAGYCGTAPPFTSRKAPLPSASGSRARKRIIIISRNGGCKWWVSCSVYNGHFSFPSNPI